MDNMYALHPNEYDKLINQFNTTLSGVWLIKGNYGMGKSCLIKSILSQLNLKYLYFEPIYSDADALISIANGIYSFYNKENESNQSIEHSMMSYPDQLKKHIFSICKKYNAVIYIDDIFTLQNQIEKSFYFDLVQLVCTIGSSNPIKVIIEVSDDLLVPSLQDYLYDLSNLIDAEHLIRLQASDDKLLYKYVFSLFKEPCLLSTEQVIRVIESGFYNPKYIKRVVECLKDIGTLHLVNNVWHCGDIDTEALYDYLKDHIRYRYNKLEENQQKLLQSASTVGYEIDLNILRQPLGILQAEQKLIRIERISELVKRKGIQYRFESDEVFYFIENEIDAEHRNKLHRLLAKHFESILPPININQNLFMLRQIFWKTANHFYKSNSYEQALDYFTKYAIASYRLKDYASIIECKKQLENDDDYFDFSTLHISVKKVWTRLLAEANQQLGNFSIAATFWDELLSFSIGNTLSHDDLFKFKRAYCLRRGGSVFEARKILEELKETQKSRNSILLADVLIVLTGIADQLGEKDDKERFYNWSLDLCQQFEDKTKYYKLLRKSNMFYSPSVAIPLMQEAFCYFENRQDSIEAGKAAYNIGMSLIQDSQTKHAYTYLQRACDIFSEYGSRNLSYVFCAIGILHGLNHDYAVAQEYFLKVIDLSTNRFAVLTAKLNLYYCYKWTAKHQKARKILNECEDELQKNGADKLVLQRNLYFAKAMCELDNGNFQKCYEYILTAHEIESRALGYKTYRIYFAKWITTLSDKLHIKCSDEILDLSRNHMSKYKELCYSEKVIWGNLMFW